MTEQTMEEDFIAAYQEYQRRQRELVSHAG